VLAEIFSDTGIIVLAIVVLLLVGGTQVPKLARSLGTAKKEFEKGMADRGTSSDATDALPKSG
jgi:sec-independent protein translocase protein TatA